jgi:hypothetical protein
VAQNTGNSGTQTTFVPLVIANACVASNTTPGDYNPCSGFAAGTGRVILPRFNLIGASSHFIQYCASGTTLQLIVEASPDTTSAHFAQVSPVYGVPVIPLNGNHCAVIQVGGIYNYVAINVVSNNTGNLNVWYSGTSGPISIFPQAINSSGAATPSLCDTANSVPIASGGTTTLIAGVANTAIHLCSATLSFAAATGTGTVMLGVGTGTNCGGGFIQFFTLDTLASTPQFIPIAAANGSVYVVLGGQNLCVQNSSGSTVAVSYSMAQY